jgi:hypothetical protein
MVIEVNELYKDKNWLYDKYVNEQLSTYQIAEILSVSHQTIWKWLKKFNIQSRPRSYCLPNPKLDEYFYEVMDGLLIGDGHLNIQNDCKNVMFEISQTEKRSEFIYWIVDFFDKYNIEYRLYKKDGYKRDYIKKNGKSGYVYPQLKIRTKRYKLFNSIYHKHYNGKGRLIPEDIKLTPLQLAIWYMSDGDLKYDKRSGSYQIRIATHRYYIDDLKWLVDEINKLYGIKFNIYRECKNKENCGYRLATGKKYQVYKFCKLIEPYMCNCFKYKIECLNDEQWLSKL